MSSGKTHLILGCKGASPFALAWGYNKWGLNENRGFVTVQAISLTVVRVKRGNQADGGLMILACIGQRMQPYFCKDIPSAIIYLTSYRRYSHSAPLERERQTLVGYRHGNLYRTGCTIAFAIRSADCYSLA